jgi:hypothetical protein
LVDSAVRLCHHGLARQFGVGANQAELRVAPGVRTHLRQRVLQVRQRAKGPLRQGCSAIQGECSYRPSSSASASAGWRR